MSRRPSVPLLRRATRLGVAALVTAGLAGCDFSRPLRVLDAPRTVVRVDIAPAAVTRAVGDTVRFRAEVIGEGGRTLSEFSPRWSSGNPAVVEVVAPGVGVVRRRGSAEILATAGGVRGRAVVQGT